jgi:integrase
LPLERFTLASVRKRKWTTGGKEREAWLVDYVDQGGTRHIRTFRTKKEVDAYRTEAGFEVSRGLHTHPSKSITVVEAGELWVRQAETDKLERSTVQSYRRHLELHIKPHLGSVKLSSLTSAIVETFRNTLISNGRSAALTRKIIVSLGAIVATAQALGKVAHNVVRDRDRRRERGQARHKRGLEVGRDIPSKDELRAILNGAAEHTKGHRKPGYWRALITTTIFTGLRASELRGLRWADVDLKAGEIHVRQRADQWRAIGPPKSHAGKRSVPLAPIVVNVLREWKLTCPKGDGDFVFPNGLGNVEALENIYKRGLEPIQIAAGLTIKTGHKDEGGKPIVRAKYRIHALRHAAASLFIEQGFQPKRVQAIMGHSSIQLTFDRYGHLFPSPEADKEAMALLQARLLAPGAT